MIEYNYMKNNKGMTLIELIVSIVLLSVILIFLHTLVNNLAFNEMDKHYDDNVMRDLLVDNVQENLIHFGLAYNEEEPVPVTLSDDKTMITINTLVGKSIILVNKDENNLYEIVYNDAYGKNAIWGLSEDLDVDVENISIKLGDNNNKGNTYLKIVIPVYEKEKESKDNNYTYNDFIINYYGKNNLNTGKYIDPDVPEEDTEKEIPLSDYLIKNGNMWQSGLEGDGYRYVGSGAVGTDTNPNNFICFGTNNKSECTANQDKYMYRVLGVFSDANGNNHVKLIKYKQLIKANWNDTNADVNWRDSTLYASLNGSGFLTNTTYDYLQDTVWSNRIENWTWSAVNTKTYEDQTNNPHYYSTTKGIYLNEMHKISAETLCMNYRETAINCNGGEWTNPTSKIGLMYASDYALSLGSSALALTVQTNYSRLKTGWMHPSNNDTTKSSYEWTLSRYGAKGGNFYVWSVYSDGSLNNYYVSNTNGARPVFYLTSNQAYLGGNGSLDDPYIITP